MRIIDREFITWPQDKKSGLQEPEQALLRF